MKDNISDKILEQLLDSTAMLAQIDSKESWKVADALINYVKQYAKQEIYANFIINQLMAPEGSLRDLGATLITTEINDTQQKKYETMIKNIIINLPASKRGIYDTHEYAQLRAVIAAIECNWLTPELWHDPAKQVLERHEKEMPDLVKPYLEKGMLFYEVGDD